MAQETAYLKGIEKTDRHVHEAMSWIKMLRGKKGSYVFINRQGYARDRAYVGRYHSMSRSPNVLGDNFNMDNVSIHLSKVALVRTYLRNIECGIFFVADEKDMLLKPGYHLLGIGKEDVKTQLGAYKIPWRRYQELFKGRKVDEKIPTDVHTLIGGHDNPEYGLVGKDGCVDGKPLGSKEISVSKGPGFAVEEEFVDVDWFMN